MEQMKQIMEQMKWHQVNHELERLRINKDIKYGHYPKIAEERVKHYKKLEGLKLKIKMEEQAIYQNIQDRHQYIQDVIKSCKETKN